MKKKIFLFGSLLIFSSLAFPQSGWIQQQSGTNLKLCKVFFVNSQTGWIVGDSGKILRKTNGGVDWISQISNTNASFISLIFINNLTGWIGAIDRQTLVIKILY